MENLCTNSCNTYYFVEIHFQPCHFTALLAFNKQRLCLYVSRNSQPLSLSASPSRGPTEKDNDLPEGPVEYFQMQRFRRNPGGFHRTADFLLSVYSSSLGVTFTRPYESIQSVGRPFVAKLVCLKTVLNNLSFAEEPVCASRQ